MTIYISTCKYSCFFFKIYEYSVGASISDTSYIYIYIYIYIYTMVAWKIQRLTNLLSWNLTKWGLFFNKVPWVVHTYSIDKAVLVFHWSKKQLTADMVSSYELFSTTSYIYIYIYIYVCVCVCVCVCTERDREKDREGRESVSLPFLCKGK